MIKREYYKTRNDGVRIFKNYSNNGLQIKKFNTNEIYTDGQAFDIESAPYIYEEIDIKVEVNDVRSE